MDIQYRVFWRCFPKKIIYRKSILDPKWGSIMKWKWIRYSILRIRWFLVIFRERSWFLVIFRELSDPLNHFKNPGNGSKRPYTHTHAANSYWRSLAKHNSLKLYILYYLIYIKYWILNITYYILSIIYYILYHIYI